MLVLSGLMILFCGLISTAIVITISWLLIIIDNLSIILHVVNMADAAAARREARRRRILENSHNRLQLISGKTSEESLEVPPIPSVAPIAVENHEVESSPSDCLSSILQNGLHFSETDALRFLSTHLNDASGDNELTNEFSTINTNASQTEQTTQTLWEKLVLYKYDIVILSLITQILNSLSTIMIGGTYFFLPVIVYVTTKLLMFPSQNHSKLASIFMLMNGMSSVQVQKILLIVQLVITFAEDVCIFLFCTISIQALWQMLTFDNNLIT